MYIIKISENKVEGYYNGLPNMLDGYHECVSLDEAMELRKEWIERYPFLVEVEIFESNKIVVNDTLQDNVRKRKEEYWNKVEQYRSLGLHGFKEYNDKGEVVFEF